METNLKFDEFAEYFMRDEGKTCFKEIQPISPFLFAPCLI